MDVSVIIVNWNTRDILCNCLQSVYEQAGEVDFEVIVIDNASTDGSVEMVKKDFPQVDLIENSKNRGFAAANNQGMAIAHGRYVLLLNSDTIVLDGAIQKTVEFADQQAAMAVVGCKVLNPDRTIQATCFMFPSLLNLLLSATYLYKLFPRSRFFGRERMLWWDRNDVREVEVVTGCFMLVRREAIEQVGVMDEAFFMYAEETDWCYRFKKAGYRSLFFPGAQIIHLGGQSSTKVKVRMLIELRLSVLRFCRGHYSSFVFVVCALLIQLFFLARIPYWKIAILLAGKSRENSRSHLQAYSEGLSRVKIYMRQKKRG